MLTNTFFILSLTKPGLNTQSHGLFQADTPTMATPFKRPTALGAIECTAAIGIPFAFDSEGMRAWLLLPVSGPHNTRVGCSGQSFASPKELNYVPKVSGANASPWVHMLECRCPGVPF